MKAGFIMSTRGTYTVKAKFYEHTITKHFYIHHDNYPEGAAHHLREFIMFEGRGSAIERFLRALPYSEFTDNPENHGDTEYHYTIDATTWEIVAFELKRDWQDGKNDKKIVFFSGLLVDFINKYGDEKDCLMFKTYPITRKALEEKYNAELSRACLWTAGGHIGNASGMASECFKMFRVLYPDRGLPKELDFLAGIYAKSYGWKGENPKQDYIDRMYLGLELVR
jgi:hypothetical protein